MTKRNEPMNNTYIRRAIALFVMLSAMLSLCSCSVRGNVTYSDDIKKVSTGNSGTEYHTAPADGYEQYSSSGLLKLFFDKKTCSIAVQDTSKGKIWYSIPQDENTKAGVVQVTVRGGNTEYVLNSQDNSVAYKTATYKKTSKGVDVTYVMCSSKNDPAVKVRLKVSFYLSDGSFYANVKCASLLTKAPDKDYVITKLSLLPYFGAEKTAASGDFLMIPDGCGAIIHLDAAGSGNYSLKTYGDDAGTGESGYKTALTGAFGCRSSGSEFAAVITDGDAVSDIKAIKSTSDFSRVWSEYDITQTGTKSSKKGEKTVTAAGSYSGNITVCYRFLSGSSATYESMAAICREQYIRSGVLSNKTVSDDEDEAAPVILNVAGGKYTSYSELEEMLSLLKAKGIDSIDIRYIGAFTGGLYQTNISDAGISDVPGSSADLEELYNYCSAQNFGLMLDTDIITGSGGGSRAKSSSGGSVVITRTSPLGKYGTDKTYTVKGVKLSALEKNVNRLLNKTKKLTFSGFCIDDAGSILFSDCKDGYTDRQSAAAYINEQIVSLSTDRSTMVCGGNFYALKSADFINGLPMQTAYKNSDAYEAVPFIQLVIHGTADYSGTSLNLSNDAKTYLLKSIEYGAIPSFTISFDDIKGIYYDDMTEDITDAYTKAGALFSDLRSARMTGHEKLADGLYRTEYNDSTYVYVNYNSTDAVYNSLTVPAGGYLRVN